MSQQVTFIWCEDEWRTEMTWCTASSSCFFCVFFRSDCNDRVKCRSCRRVLEAAQRFRYVGFFFFFLSFIGACAWLVRFTLSGSGPAGFTLQRELVFIPGVELTVSTLSERRRSNSPWGFASYWHTCLRCMHKDSWENRNVWKRKTEACVTLMSQFKNTLQTDADHWAPVFLE